MPSHGWVHEAIAALVGNVGEEQTKGQVSIAAGRGIAPFGSDPAMMRPAVKPPVNQHWTEIMDRWLVVAGARIRGFGLELGVFDKGPGVATATAAPSDTSAHHHVTCLLFCGERGASSSARVTVWPVRGVEIRASLATEFGGGHHAASGGTTQQWNLSARVDRAGGASRISVLAEVGRIRAEQVFHTVLSEAQWQSGNRRHRLYYRFERTDRPDGARSADGFGVIGDTLGLPSPITRWTVHTAGYGFTFRHPRFILEPLIEGSIGRVRSTGATPVDVGGIYGRSSHWSVLGGVRLALGAGHVMGRYGALGPAREEPGGHGAHGMTEH
jgi:hypothetical protein